MVSVHQPLCLVYGWLVNRQTASGHLIDSDFLPDFSYASTQPMKKTIIFLNGVAFQILLPMLVT